MAYILGNTVAEVCNLLRQQACSTRLNEIASQSAKLLGDNYQIVELFYTEDLFSFSQITFK